LLLGHFICILGYFKVHLNYYGHVVVRTENYTYRDRSRIKLHECLSLITRRFAKHNHHFSSASKYLQLFVVRQRYLAIINIQ
jgi:hypothetical protein